MIKKSKNIYVKQTKKTGEAFVVHFVGKGNEVRQTFYNLDDAISFRDKVAREILEKKMNQKLQKYVTKKDEFPFNLMDDLGLNDCKKYNAAELVIISNNFINRFTQILNIGFFKEREKNVIFKRYVDGKVYREIADDMGVSIERVRQILERALYIFSRHTRYFCSTVDIESYKEKEMEEIKKYIESAKKELLYEEAKKIVKNFEKDYGSLEYENVEKLGLSIRVLNCLIRNDKTSIAWLMIADRKTLLDIKGLGEKGVLEIEQKLYAYKNNKKFKQKYLK